MTNHLNTFGMRYGEVLSSDINPLHRSLSSILPRFYRFRADKVKCNENKSKCICSICHGLIKCTNVIVIYHAMMPSITSYPVIPASKNYKVRIKSSALYCMFFSYNILCMEYKGMLYSYYS